MWVSLHFVCLRFKCYRISVVCQLREVGLNAGMVAGMVRSGCQMCISWTQVNSLLRDFQSFHMHTYALTMCGYGVFHVWFELNDCVNKFPSMCHDLFFIFPLSLLEQCRLNGWSFQLLVHCHHLDVATLLQWLRSDYWCMVAEVIEHACLQMILYVKFFYLRCVTCLHLS